MRDIWRGFSYVVFWSNSKPEWKEFIFMSSGKKTPFSLFAMVSFAKSLLLPNVDLVSKSWHRDVRWPQISPEDGQDSCPSPSPTSITMTHLSASGPDEAESPHQWMDISWLHLHCLAVTVEEAKPWLFFPVLVAAGEEAKSKYNVSVAFDRCRLQHYGLVWCHWCHL